MNARGERRLVSLRRRVPAERLGEYAELWRELAAAVTADGSHAWRFVSADDPGLHLEFLEFRADADPRSRPTVEAALDRLDRAISPALTEEWLEPR